MPRIGSHVFNVRDFVKETTQTSGTGAYQLDGVTFPEQGHQSFLTAVGDGQKTLYAVKRAGTWEKAIGTVTAGAPVTLSRDLILGTSADDSIGASPINWPSTDPKDIYIGASASLLNRFMGPGEVLWGGVSSGTNVVAVTVDPIITAYWDGMVVWFKKNTAANTGNVNININSIGEVDLLKAQGVEIPAGELAANALVGAVYVAALNDFVVISGLTRIGATKGEIRIYTSGATWTKPAGLLFVEVEMIGGGGSGASVNDSTRCSGGGGGGEYAFARIPTAAIGATVAVTVGAGGASSAAGNNNGNPGGTSSFGSLLTAIGGGAGNAISGNFGLGGTGATGGTGSGSGSVRYHIGGGTGGTGVGIASNVSSLANGGAGGGALGGGGGRGRTGVNGETGRNYGGGGGGCNGDNLNGGAGAPGIVIVREFHS